MEMPASWPWVVLFRWRETSLPPTMVPTLPSHSGDGTSAGQSAVTSLSRVSVHFSCSCNERAEAMLCSSWVIRAESRPPTEVA